MYSHFTWFDPKFQWIDPMKISGFWPLSFLRSRSIFRAAKTESPVSGHAGYKLEETAEIQCINNPEAKNSSALFQCRFFLENQSEFICNYWITDTREIIARLGKPCIAMWTKRIYICQEIVQACENIRFSSLFADGDVSKSEEKRMFLQARDCSWFLIL